MLSLLIPGAFSQTTGTCVAMQSTHGETHLPGFYLLFIDDTEQKGDFFLSHILVHSGSSAGSQGRAWMADNCRSCRMLVAIPVTVYQVLSLQDSCPWAVLGTPSSLC